MKGPRSAAVALFLMLASGFAAAQGSQPPGSDAALADAKSPTRMVTFYPHVFAATANFPMPGNTQFPKGEDDFSAGYPGNGCYPETLSPLQAVPNVPIGTVPGVNIFFDNVTFPSCEDFDNNILYVYSTAGFVHASFDSFVTDRYTQFHNERGQAKDILLDTSQDITSTFFMSADWHAWVGICGNVVSGIPSPYPCWNWDPGVAPKWQVEATLFLGSMGEYQGQASEAPPVHAKIKSGDVVEVARGVSEPADMVSLDSNVNSLVGGAGEVYKFNINLGKPKVDKIPKEADWIMRFRWWDRTDDSTKVILGQRFNWNINSGEFYPNSFALPIRNPFDVELVYPQFLHDKMLIHAMLNSPWGSYDVDSRSVKIDITSDAGAVPFQTVDRTADFSVAHGGHYKPVNLTWVWDYKGDKAPAGDYRVSVQAWNFQHSASSTTSATFRIAKDGSGTVLSIGRSGQQTSTQSQLQAIGASGGNGNVTTYSASQPVAASGLHASPGFEPLAGLGLLAAIAVVLWRRSR